MKFNKLIVGFVLLTAVIIGGGSYLIAKTSAPQLAADQAAQANVTETSFDWGTIGINDGIVEKTFTITNNGAGPLKLAGVVTSCMCTTAQVKTSDSLSPAFGMHQKSSWSEQVEPGQSADLIVAFDPAFHGPSGVGAITRIVTVDTNDASQPQLSFTLTANVVN
ncbi:MAG TPA: DUF1573 domain-containing protein [Patescibacteria group bacterium]|nr:DUF1573 domain-containing protein [Patescibacteria group bacterium]